jgi:hypothetical protein
VRLILIEALERVGARDESRSALGRARDWLLLRASRISESAWRQRFLNDVPQNAQILALVNARIC